MLDCLSTIDKFAISVGLPAMGHLEQLTSLFSRQEYCVLRLRSLESIVVRVVLNIRCSTWGFLLLTKSICDYCLKILQHLGSPYFKTLSRQATTYRIPLAFSYTAFQYTTNDVVLRTRRSFLAEILFRFSGVELLS